MNNVPKKIKGIDLGKRNSISNICGNVQPSKTTDIEDIKKAEKKRLKNCFWSMNLNRTLQILFIHKIVEPNIPMKMK